MPEKVVNIVAYIIQQICSITGSKPGKTALQKMVCLIQLEGVDLGFPYGTHCYGVYSETLNTVISQLTEVNIICVERKGSSYLMDVNRSYRIESGLGKETEKKIAHIIEKYRGKTPAELELLTKSANSTE